MSCTYLFRVGFLFSSFFCRYRGTGILPIDVVRHVLPDGILFIVTTVCLVTNALVVAGGKCSGKVRKKGDEVSQREEAEDGDPETSRDGMSYLTL